MPSDPCPAVSHTTPPPARFGRCILHASKALPQLSRRPPWPSLRARWLCSRHTHRVGPCAGSSTALAHTPGHAPRLQRRQKVRTYPPAACAPPRRIRSTLSLALSLIPCAVVLTAHFCVISGLLSATMWEPVHGPGLSPHLLGEVRPWVGGSRPAGGRERHTDDSQVIGCDRVHAW